MLALSPEYIEQQRAHDGTRFSPTPSLMLCLRNPLAEAINDIGVANGSCGFGGIPHRTPNDADGTKFPYSPPMLYIERGFIYRIYTAQLEGAAKRKDLRLRMHRLPGVKAHPLTLDDYTRRVGWGANIYGRFFDQFIIREWTREVKSRIGEGWMPALKDSNIYELPNYMPIKPKASCDEESVSSRTREAWGNSVLLAMAHTKLGMTAPDSIFDPKA